MDRSSAASKRFEAAGESKVAQRNTTSKYGYAIAMGTAAAVAVGSAAYAYSSIIPLHSLDQLNDMRATAGVRPMTSSEYWMGQGTSRKGVDWL